MLPITNPLLSQFPRMFSTQLLLPCSWFLLWGPVVEKWPISQANLRKGWPLIHNVTLSTNFESTSLLGTGQESIEPILSRYIWKGCWIKCTRHQEKKARGRLLELKQDWVCTISKDIPEEKPCREDGRPNKELSASPPLPAQLPKHGEQSLAGAANQPVRPEAGKWERNNLLRATQGVKATGAFRSREQQLGCYKHSAAPTAILLAPTLCMCSTAVSQGSSVTLILFPFTVWLTSNRCNVLVWGWENNRV